MAFMVNTIVFSRATGNLSKQRKRRVLFYPGPFDMAVYLRDRKQKLPKPDK